MVTKEIKEVERIVKNYFDVYEMRITSEALKFYFTVASEEELERRFDRLRTELVPRDIIPMVRRENGEYVIIVVRRPHRRYRSIVLNVVLLIATVFSTIFVGMGYYMGYYGETSFLNAFIGGFIFFSAPLLLILGSHEMGHYFMAKKYKVAASLPFFIPAPTMLGTLGAFISLRDPIPNRKALLDIGIAGPIVGFLVAIPVTIIGLYLGSVSPPNVTPEQYNSYILFNVPIIYELLNSLIPAPPYMHPVAVAGWVGFVVTAINLFPIGQLDGGHVARAIFGKHARYISYVFGALLIIMGIMLYPGWAIFGVIVFVLGLRHPPPLDDITPLDKKHFCVGVFAFLLLAVTFVPVPMQMVVLHENVELDATVNSTIMIENYSEYANLSIHILNKGEMRENITLTVSGEFNLSATQFVFSLDPGNGTNLSVQVRMLDAGNHTLSVKLKTKTHMVKWWNTTIMCLTESPTLHFEPSTVHSFAFNTTLINGDGNRTVYFMSLTNVSFNITNLESNRAYLKEGENMTLKFVVLGYTTIIAIDYSNYEAAILRVVP